jgi:hypothetical protein
MPRSPPNEELEPVDRDEARSTGSRRHLIELAVGRQAHAASRPRGQSLEGPATTDPLDVVARRGDVAVVLDPRPHHDDPIGLVEGQRRKQSRVDDAEDRGVGGDAERERKNGDGGKGRLSPEQPQGQTGVPQDVCHELLPPWQVLRI